MVESENLSLITQDPWHKEGCIVFTQCSRRAAYKINVSEIGSQRSYFPETKRLRNSSAPNEPPGSLVNTTSFPLDSKYFFNLLAWVDLPAPSPPSKEIKRPLSFSFLLITAPPNQIIHCGYDSIKRPELLNVNRRY